MATSIYLGNPPENIKKWIIDNYVEPWPEKTSVVYTDGTTSEYLIEDTLSYDSIPNIENVKEIIIGSKVLYINPFAFDSCTSLISVTIPDNVIDIGDGAFSGCSDTLFDTINIPGIYCVDGWIVHSDNLFTSSELDLTKFRGIAGYGLCNDTHTITTLILPDTFTNIGYVPFSGHKITNMPQTSSERVIYLLTNNSLNTDGYGDISIDENGEYIILPFTATITCKDGIVNATSIIDADLNVEGWDITVTPL